MGKRNELSALTRRECEFLVRECNFTRDERDVFNLRIQDWSVVHISIELCMSESKVKRKLFDIKQKIEKVRSE